MADWGIDVSGIESLATGIDQTADALEDVRYTVGTSVEYAVYLEFGTSEMRAYPFLRPAVEKVMNERADAIADNADSVEQVIRDIAFAIEQEAKHFASDNVPPGPDEVTGNLKGSIRAERVG